MAGYASMYMYIKPSRQIERRIPFILCSLLASNNFEWRTLSFSEARLFMVIFR